MQKLNNSTSHKMTFYQQEDSIVVTPDSLEKGMFGRLSVDYVNYVGKISPRTRTEQMDIEFVDQWNPTAEVIATARHAVTHLQDVCRPLRVIADCRKGVCVYWPDVSLSVYPNMSFITGPTFASKSFKFDAKGEASSDLLDALKWTLLIRRR